MPWLLYPMKDVVVNDIFGELTNKHWPGGFRIGKPITSNVVISLYEKIVQAKDTQWTETSK